MTPDVAKAIATLSARLDRLEGRTKPAIPDKPPEAAISDIDRVVFQHVLDRLNHGLRISQTARGYGPEQISEDLRGTVASNITPGAVRVALRRLTALGLLTYHIDPGKRLPPSWRRGPMLEN